MARNLLEQSVLAQRALAALRAKATPTVAMTSRMTENVSAPAPGANDPGPPDAQLAEILLGSADGSRAPTGFSDQPASGYAMPGTRRAYRELAEVAPFVAKRKPVAFNYWPVTSAEAPRAASAVYSPDLGIAAFPGRPAPAYAGHENLHVMQQENFPSREGNRYDDLSHADREKERAMILRAIYQPARGRLAYMSQQHSDELSTPAEWQAREAERLIQQRIGARAVASLAAGRRASVK